MKKSFFREDSLSQILQKNYCEFVDLGEIQNLAFSDKYTIIPARISNDEQLQKNFLKHGPEIKLERAYSVQNSLELENPSRLCKAAFEDGWKNLPSAYSFKPYWGLDRKNRRVSLINCYLGAKLYSYSENNPEESIKIKIYGDSLRVAKEGAKVHLEVPSTCEDSVNYKFFFEFIPVIDNFNKNKIWQQINSTHRCDYKEFSELRYNFFNSREDSTANNFCFHEIAGYFKIIDEFVKRNNRIPLEMNPFVIPRKSTINFNLALENNVLIFDKTLETKDKLRKPKFADKELLNWERIFGKKYEELFFYRPNSDGKLKDFFISKRTGDE